MNKKFYFDISNIEKAAEVICGIADNTPLIPSQYLSNYCETEVFLKLENVQPTGAFKIRGALNAVHNLSPKIFGVTCCSTGNHGRGVAYAAKRRGLRVIIFMSKLVPRVKIEAIESLGAEVRLVGEDQAEAEVACKNFVNEHRYVEIPPFDNVDVISGQGTIGLELLNQNPQVNTIVVPLSGGGLASGVALAARFKKPSVQVVGVTMENGAVMHHSLSAGKPVDLKEEPSLADALGGGIGLDNRYTFQLCRDFLSETVTVSEEEIYQAMQVLYYEDRMIVEGSCAVTVAALMSGKIANLSGPIAVIVTGRNVNMPLFTDVITGKFIMLGNRKVGGKKYENV